MKYIVFFLLSIFTLFGNIYAQGFHLIITAENEVRVENNKSLKIVSSIALPDFSIDVNTTKQTIKGFGGAFNEQGWIALQSLGKEERDAVIRNIFSPKEGNLSWGRIPIGASDYALQRYTLAPVAGDFEMKYFTIDRDKQYLIPYIKAAKSVRPDIVLWGSAWSPPVWMKDNGQYEGGNFIDSDNNYKAYALYLEKFVKEYAEEGLAVSAVAVQNEPTVVTGYPNGGWTPQQFRKFIRNYAGPFFKKNNVRAEIWLATLNEGNYDTFVKTVLDDSEARKYVAAVGLQWDGDKQIPFIKKYYPDIPIIQTETDCGNWTWKTGFNKDKAPNDFKYAAYTWGRITDYLSAGAEAYMLWNIILDQNGKNIDNKLPWPQNSGIVIDTVKKEVVYTPMFRAFEHFSRYVVKGSLVLSAGGSLKNVMAFRDPSGRIIVELMNSSKLKNKINGTIGNRMVSFELPAESFTTLIIDAEPVQSMRDSPE